MLAPLGLALKEQRLAEDRGDCGGLERLGDQEGRLRPLSSKESLRVSGDEDHRHLKNPQQLVDRVESGTAVGELDVCQDQTRTLGFGQRNRFRMRSRYTEHTMA